MIDIIGILIVCSMCGITISSFMKWSRKQDAKKNGEYYLEKINSLDVTSKEFFKVLNFMLMYGIITFEEYQEMERKALSYVS